jgi:hypothetical protein
MFTVRCVSCNAYILCIKIRHLHEACFKPEPTNLVAEIVLHEIIITFYCLEKPLFIVKQKLKSVSFKKAILKLILAFDEVYSNF